MGQLFTIQQTDLSPYSEQYHVPSLLGAEALLTTFLLSHHKLFCPIYLLSANFNILDTPPFAFVY